MLMISIVGISMLISDAISDYISSFLFHHKPHGNLIAVGVGAVMLLLEGYSYIILKGLFAVIFSLFGWFVVSRYIEKTSMYNYVLCKTEKMPILYGWLVWVGFSLLPIFVLYLSSNFEVMVNKPEFNNIYKYGLLKLNGHIDKNMTYEINTFYSARNKSRKCRAKLTDEIHSKQFNFKPLITNTLHGIIIPLDTVKESFCDYQINRIRICLTRKEAQQKTNHKFGCYTLFKSPSEEDSMSEYLGYHFMSDGLVYQKMENNKLNIYCGTRKNELETGISFCTQDRRKRKSITQYLQKGTHSYLINIYDQ